jgi:hypothetical protein
MLCRALLYTALLKTLHNLRLLKTSFTPANTCASQMQCTASDDAAQQPCVDMHAMGMRRRAETGSSHWHFIVVASQMKPAQQTTNTGFLVFSSG